MGSNALRWRRVPLLNRAKVGDSIPYSGSRFGKLRIRGGQLMFGFDSGASLYVIRRSGLQPGPIV